MTLQKVFNFYDCSLLFPTEVVDELEALNFLLRPLYRLSFSLHFTLLSSYRARIVACKGWSLNMVLRRHCGDLELWAPFFQEKGTNLCFKEIKIKLYMKKEDSRESSLSFYVIETTYEKLNYLVISATTPEATVLPPSLIANLSPSSIAIG